MSWTHRIAAFSLVGSLASGALAQPSGATRERAISMPSGEGSISGMGESFGADLASGAASYSVPLALPPGRAGAQPGLTLGYASTQGNSVLGMGWSLPVSSIARRTDRGTPRYRDQAQWHAEEDSFTFGGSHLVPVSAAAAAAFDGAPAPAELLGFQQYRLATEGSFYRFYRAPDLSRWVVQTPDGGRLEFGRLEAGDGPTDLSSQDALQTGPQAEVFAWYLTRSADSHGSTIYYTYRASEGARYLSDVYYVSPNACAGHSATATRRCSAPLSQYAVRVRLVYEPRSDVAISYGSGFEVRSSDRLKRVEITSAEDAAGARYLVRRYHLGYLAGSYHSLLSSVQLEGRPETDDAATGVRVAGARVAEAALGDAVVGVTMAPLRFRYTGDSTLSTGAEGFPGLASNLVTAQASPRYGVIDADAELVDVNADGLPDVIVTDPVRYPGSDGRAAAGVYFNGFQGADARPAAPGTFSEAVRVTMPSHAIAASMRLSNSTVASMDVRGDGIEDLMRLPGLSSYGHLATARTAQGLAFAYVPVQVPVAEQDGRIDFTSEPQRLRYVDVDGDGRFDILRTSGTKLQFWRNLGGFPGGAGRFGSASHNGSGWVLSSAPFESCIPYDVAAVDFRSPALQLVDMNGDGRLDLVKRAAQRISYWPASGYGRFGTASGRCELEGLRNGHVVMSNLPSNLDATADSVLMMDVDADGRADLVRFAGSRLHVYYNKSGLAFATGLTVNGLPDAYDLGKRVRMLDIDGTGTTDVVYGDGRSYRWVDLLGGYRHRLLREVDNGRGLLTTLSYSSSSADYTRDLNAAASCSGPSCERFSWSDGTAGCDEQLTALLGTCAQRPSGSRMFSTVLRSVTVSDRLDALGAEATVQSTEYAYHDAYYEGTDRELRGFRVTDVRSLSDDAALDAVTRSTMHQGVRPAAIAMQPWLSNPHEPLKGLVSLVEKRSGAGRHLSTLHNSYTVRTLATGLDGQAIRHAFLSRVDEVPYSLAGSPAPAPGATLETTGFVGVDFQVLHPTTGQPSADASVAPLPETIPLRDARHAHLLRKSDEVDRFGHVLRATNHGRVRGEFGEPVADERVVQRSSWSLVDPAAWLWRTVRTATEGHGTQVPLADTELLWDARGSSLGQIGHVSLPRSFEFAGDNQGALGFVQAAEDTVTTRTVDAWGNVLAACAGGSAAQGPAGCLRYVETRYDSAYAQLVEVDSVFADASTRLERSASWDRGTGQMTHMTEVGGARSDLGYNGFGWPTFRRLPAVAGCEASSVPTWRTTYALTTEPAARPLSVVETHIDTSCSAAGADAVTSRSYVDGAGRVRVALQRAEAPHGWVRSGFTKLDRQARPRVSYAADSVPYAAPTLAQVLATPSTAATLTSYDAFGRVHCLRDAAGALTCSTYHALSSDLCDARAQDPASFAFGTCTTVRQDGHGRVIDEITRNRRDALAGLETIRTWHGYRADGSRLTLTRAKTTDDAPRPLAGVMAGREVTRSFTYDSLGRRLASTDRDTDARRPGAGAGNATWRYLYNRTGDVVATRDPRGCGVNAFYDLAGRKLGEQYVGCAEAPLHEGSAETVPAGSVALLPLESAVQVDARYYHDRYPAWATGDLAPPASAGSPLGTLTASADRAQRTVAGYDLRGNLVRAAKQLALLPEPAANGSVAPGDLVRYDEANTYVHTAGFDHAARPRSIGLPADPDAAAGAPRLTGQLHYNARGLPASTSFTLDDSVHDISTTTFDARGLPLQISYGDGHGGRAPTLSQFEYDELGRALRLRTTREPTADAGDEVSLSGVSVVADQTLTWDEVGNLTRVFDGRIASEWPAGFKPQHVEAQHDALDRVTGVLYRYGSDTGLASDVATDYRSTLEQLSAVDPMRRSAPPAVSSVGTERVTSLTYDTDWLGNVVESSDDAHAFHERSLGRRTYGFDEPGGRPSALRFSSDLPTRAAAQLSGEVRGGYLEVQYGEGGFVSTVDVHGGCSDDLDQERACWDDASLGIAARSAQLAASCRCAVEQHYAYRWDELGRLADARRDDRSATGWQQAARMRYRYDAANRRVIKEARDDHDATRIALTIFDGDFERRGLFIGDDDRYEAYADAETQYLIGGARVVWQSGATGPALHAGQRITVPVSDVVGSTSAVLDLRSGELVEAGTYYPNGARETLLSGVDGAVASEPLGFTGKEADDEVGLVYFGERYLLPYLGSWASADPLQVHAEGGGETLNNYHYMAGNLLQGRDALGLCDESTHSCLKVTDGDFGNEVTLMKNIRYAAPGNSTAGATDWATANRLGEAWVEEGFTVGPTTRDGAYSLISRDGLRRYRSPAFKDTKGFEGWRANFESRRSIHENWTQNAPYNIHVDITDGWPASRLQRAARTLDVHVPHPACPKGAACADGFAVFDMMNIPGAAEESQKTFDEARKDPGVRTGARYVRAKARELQAWTGIFAAGGIKPAGRILPALGAADLGAGHVENGAAVVAGDKSLASGAWWFATHHPAWGLGTAIGWLTD